MMKMAKIELTESQIELMEHQGCVFSYPDGDKRRKIYHIPQFFVEDETGGFDICFYSDELPDDIKEKIKEIIDVSRRNEPKVEL